MIWVGICATEKAADFHRVKCENEHCHLSTNPSSCEVPSITEKSRIGLGTGSICSFYDCSLLRIFPGFWGEDVWLANSSDLNSMGFSMWSIMEQTVSGTRWQQCNTWCWITVEEFESFVGNFRKRPQKYDEARKTILNTFVNVLLSCY